MKKLNLSLFLLFAAACALTSSCAGGTASDSTTTAKSVSLKVVMPSSSGRNAIISKAANFSNYNFSAHLLSEDGSYSDSKETEFGSGETATLEFEEIEVGLELRAFIDVYDRRYPNHERFRGVSDYFTVSEDDNEVTVNMELMGEGVTVTPNPVPLSADTLNFSDNGIWSRKYDGTYKWILSDTAGIDEITLPNTSSSFSIPVGDISYYVPDAYGTGLKVRCEWKSSLDVEWLHEENNAFVTFDH